MGDRVDPRLMGIVFRPARGTRLQARRAGRNRWKLFTRLKKKVACCLKEPRSNHINYKTREKSMDAATIRASDFLQRIDPNQIVAQLIFHAVTLLEHVRTLVDAKRRCVTAHSDASFWRFFSALWVSDLL